MSRIPIYEEITTKTGPSIALFIKRYLQLNTKGYSYAIYREYIKLLRENMILPCSKNHVYTYIYMLKKLGLIRVLKKQRSLERRHFNITYYTIVEGKDKDERWLNPQVYFRMLK